MQQFATNKKNPRKQKQSVEMRQSQKKTDEQPDIFSQFVDDSKQNLTMLGMQHKALYHDTEDPSMMSMYNRKIGGREFG